MKNAILIAVSLLLAVACTNEKPKTVETPTVAEQPVEATETPIVAEQKNAIVRGIEEAHNKQAFLSKQAVSFDLLLMFRGKERLKGKMTLSTDSEKGRIDFADGKKLYYNGNEVAYSEGFGEAKKVRFDAYTWSYFFLFPYKLSDPGTKWQAYESEQSGEAKHLTQKLTFEAGTGDDPEDWYIVYANKENNLIDYAAYIVTANKTREEAEKDPHAISYSDYEMVDGVSMAKTWKFWGWQSDKGLTDQLGEATLTNIQFVEPAADFFEAPADFLKK